MKQKIISMLSMQDKMNTKVHAQWREQNFQWYRAIWIECAELLDHYGWKWWKKQTPDVDQIALELVDIWHFGLSLLLISDLSEEDIVNRVCSAFDQSEYEGDFANDLEDFTERTLSTKDFDVEQFSRLMVGINMDFDTLHVGYIGKNVLNFFRQDNGYQDGTYNKQWNGVEDNEHLVDIASTLDTSSPDFADILYQKMQDRYEELCQ
jgi:dimeric dUTPase (all-alpha-NTP-PPase superfamily)